MNAIISKMLEIVSGITGTPKGAYNIRLNGKSMGQASSPNIKIVNKEGGKGIDVYVSPNTKNEVLHIPVIMDQSGQKDLVYNDFHIGENADVKIVAGCGIHNGGTHLTQHDGIHTFYLETGSSVKYTEKHYGDGNGGGKRVLNPVTVIHLSENSSMEMDTVQIEGVDMTDRTTKADLAANAKLVVKEKLMTTKEQEAVTRYEVDLNGENSSTNVVSRSVAKGSSRQYFYSVVNGNNKCAGHSECDAIIMDNGFVKAVPDVTANHVDASLIHEAAIGKIAGEQIVKLMTLGMDEEEAEQKIVEGFLK